MTYSVFISHSADDTWIAEQIARAAEDAGCSTFLDVKNIPKGADFKEAVRREISQSNELLALFTPWSAKRSWVWIEMGAAWSQGKRVVAIFHRMSVGELRAGDQGAGFLEDINAVELNELSTYLAELRERAASLGSA